MTSKVEQVARALCAAVPGTGKVDDHFSNEHPVARAAIEAMRVPNEAMMVAGCREDDILGELVDWRGDNCTTREVVSRVFNAMIDAALSEEGP